MINMTIFEKKLDVMKFYNSLFLTSLLGGVFSLNVMSQQMPLEWAYGMPGAGGDAGKDIVTDANGNVILISDFNGTVDFEPGAGVTNLTSAGGQECAIAKYDSDGNLIWAVKVGGTGNDAINSVDVDNAGNIYAAGTFQNTVDFDPGAGTANLTSNGAADTYILMLDPNGIFGWVKRIGGTADDATASIDVDNSGNILASGFFRNTVDFDPNAGTVNTTSNGSADVFVLKLNSSGNYVWHYALGSTTDDDARGVRTDASGNVYVTGFFTFTVDFDFSASTQNLISNTGSSDIFVLKISSSGAYVNAVQVGGTGFDSGRSINVDSQGDILITGMFSSTTDFDPGVGTNNKISGGGFDIFVLKLDNTLNHVWASTASASADDEGHSIETDDFDNVFIAGFFRTTADFDPGAGTQNVTVSGGGSFADQFYWKLDSDGNYLSADKAGAGGNDHSFAFYPSGNHVYITGYLQGTSNYDFEGGTTNLTSAGSGDIYLAKYYNCNPIHVNDVIVSCGPITWIDGNTYSVDNNTATHTLTSINGCDSTVHLNLMIKSINDQTVTPSISTICDDADVTVDLGSSQAGVFYSLVDQSTMTVVDGPLEGNGATLTLDAGNVTTTTTYEVQAERNRYNALTFTGNSATPTHVSLGNDINKEFAGTYEITVEAWINTDNTNDLQTVASTYTGLGNTMQFLLRLDQTAGQNKAAFWIGTGTTPASYIQVVGTTTILPDTWYHLAGTYDGSFIKVYVNGVLENQVAVTTPIPNVNNDFRIGGGLNSNTEYFYGDITGVRLWNVARSQTEISSNMDNCIDGNEPGLVAMYNMVDGTGSSMLTDESGNGYDGTLTNMNAATSWNYTNMPDVTCAMCYSTMTTTPTVTVNQSSTGTDVQDHCVSYTWIDGNTYTTSNSTATHTLTNSVGCDSVVTLNLTISQPNTGTDVQNVCESLTWIDGNTYTANNTTATFTLTNIDGCDSVVTLNLTVGAVVATATNNGDGTLSATGSGTYQWIDCGTNTAVAGATSASFIPVANGDYAVVVTNGSCDDTSACITYNSVGLNENGNSVFTAYPNPTTGLISINSSNAIIAKIVVRDAAGRVIFENSNTTSSSSIDLTEMESGIYFVTIFDANQSQTTMKVLKQ
jgi:hypothetical protein